jgi:BirA family transcriptional regulator, biotin operon repressor / biotin---[acetyl-CoA-carboxylase] ligase
MNTDSLNAEKIARALDAAGVPAEVEFYERIASTSDRARARVVLGQWDGRSPFCVAAEHQSAGRGRRGAAWVSPPGTSLLFTLANPADAWDRAEALPPLAIGLAVAEALHSLCGLKAKIKWPNDVRVGGRKICGILVERAAGPSGAALLFGVGVNVNQSEADFPEELKDKATSVAREIGRPFSRLDLLAGIVAAIGRLRDQLARGRAQQVIDAIRRRLDSVGRIVTVAPESGRRIEGTALGIEADGGLLVRETNGTVAKCLSGTLIEH